MKRNVKLRFGGSVSLPSGKWALRLIPVLGLLFSASTLRAEDNTGGVKFNPGVRYSQWAINSRSTSFNANTTQCGMATITNGSVSKGSFGKSSLDYVPGLVAKSMIEAADYYQDFDWSTPWFKSVEEYGNKYYSKVPNTGGSLDDLNAVKLYIGLYNNKNASEIYKKNYKTAISRAQAGLVEHNNANSIQPGTLAEKAGNSVEGGWFHKNIYNNQMWLDGAYMGSALLAQIINFNGTSSNIFGSSDNDWNMVAKQMNIVWNMCWNSNDKLLYHAFEANAGMGTSNSNAETWAGLSGTEPYVFHSQSYWGRANAWYLMALVDVLEAMNNAGQNNTANYTTLKQHLADLAAGIAARQDTKTGGWYQVMDKDGSLSVDSYNSSWNGKPSSATNYIETSATAIFSAAYFKAVRLGLLTNTTNYNYKEIAKNAFEGLVNNYTYLDDNNDLEIFGSCRSAGLGGNGNDYKAGGKKFRDGSNAYYLLGYDVPMVKKDENITEGKVLGGFIMAATEYERAYQNQDSKQILFAKDLAQQYDFSTTAGSLDATAYGNGTITYQWYKGDAKVADATSATYTPTESGSYYCEATANGKTIKTSTTTVTAKAATGGGDNNSGETTTGTVLFSYTVPTSGSASTNDVETTGGKIAYQKSSKFSTDGSGYKIDNSTKYIKVTLTGNKLQTGDVISITIGSGNKTKDIVLSDGGTNKIVLNSFDETSKKITYTVTATDDFNGKDIFYLYRNTQSVYVKAITITRPASETSKTDLTAAYATTSVAAIVGDANIPAPELTVTAGETPLEEGTGYSVSYTSGDENVVKVQEDGTLDAVGKGTATIMATITPVDGTKYNNKPLTLTFTINVSARPLKAVFSTNAVSANVGDEARVLPTLTVTDVNMQQQVSDYTATYSSTNEGVATVVGGKLRFGVAGKTTITVTVTPTDENTFAPCEASFDVSVADKTTTDPTKDAVVYDFKTSIGNTESANTNIKVNSDNIMFGTNFKANESKYITITPNGDGGFKAGDVIKLKGYCPKKNSGILIYAAPTDAEPQFQSPAFAATESVYTFTVQKDSPILYLGRFGGSSTYVTYLNVTRPGTSGNKTRLTAAFAKNSDVIINKPDNYVIDLPVLTVKAGNADFNEYSVVYSSNDKAVATVDGNSKKITIETPGTVTILATVTPNDANKYEGCTATYTITVKGPTPLVISAMDVMMNATDAKPKQPVIKVYGDDDKLLTLDRDYTLSFTVKSATEGETANVYFDENKGTFNVYGNEYNWKEGSSVITVTAKPITENIGDTYTVGSLTFEYNVVKGKLTPAFMNNFASGVIKIKQYNRQTNNNDKKFRVPLIYNGEDVSEYFKYTYTVKKSDGTIVTSKTTKGNEFTFRPDKEGEFTITVSAEPKTDQDNYADVYYAPADMSFNVIVSPNFIRPVITFNPESVQMYVGTTEGAPDVTVTDGTNKISEGDYNLKWVSFSPSYVKVDENTGNLEAVSEGQGSVRITVTGENLESMTAFLSVYVDDPAVYRTKSTEKYGNQRKMWNQDGTMSVTLGGWMFPNDVTNTIYSDEGLKREYSWANDATLPKWKMTGFDRFVSGEKSKNARQENGSNAMPNTTMVSSADFKTDKGTVRDAMFNVPCSGSYLTFNPKTNGTVSVHIFQNGAFDSGAYRPQRRVFVMDEQGNFVQSTPEIENANGKPTGGLKPIGNYKWDINPKGKDTAPAIEDVRSHFKNIPTDFDMTAEKFQNNVYESNLSNDIVPNAAYDEKVPGSNGWCVLADSPVTYSFKVKAGKTYYLWNFGSKIGFYGYSFDEDATKPEVDNVTYDEAATDNKIESTKEGHVAKVSINRTFKAGVWSTCVLPFSLNMSQVDAIFGDTYRFGNENGTEILYFDRVDENDKVWFVRHAYNTIVANKPFLIKPTKDVNGINTADCTEYPYVIIEAPEGGKPAAWCEGSGYSWVSGYSNNEMYVGNGDGFIAKDGSFMTYTGSPAPLKGFRGYLKKDSDTAAKILSVGVGSNVDSDNTTTLIDNLIIDNDANASQSIGDGKVYNINGQVVGNGKSFNTLPSGVYIINGKKYIK